MLEIKFALVARRSASSVVPTSECAKLISKHNERKEERAARTVEGPRVHPILKEVFSRGPVANLVGNPLRNLLFDVLGWLFSGHPIRPDSAEF